ncbi:MAG: glycosyl hydrolase, partial [Fibrobacter sp.]|nr:glycosyl hydrolase [Fibrobacter sp.]
MIKKTFIIVLICVSTMIFQSCYSGAFKRAGDSESSVFLLCSVRKSEPPQTNSQRFGFFSSRLWENYAENLKQEIDVFGATPGYVLWYLQMGDDYPVKIAEHNKSLGIYTVINQDLRSDEFSPEKNAVIMKEITDGKWDPYFKRFAAMARDMGTKVYYRFGYEMNVDWFPWGKNAKQFTNAWKHVWKIFQKEGADSVMWVFSPSVVWGSQTFEKDILPYYPGSQYVNIVALDGYNFGDNHDRYHQWESFFKVYANSITGLMSLGKPMWIAEIGCPSDPRRYQWLRDFLAFFDSNTCFEAFFWFNEHKQGEPNFRIDADLDSWSLFREWVQKINWEHRPDENMA